MRKWSSFTFTLASNCPMKSAVTVMRLVAPAPGSKKSRYRRTCYVIESMKSAVFVTVSLRRRNLLSVME